MTTLHPLRVELSCLLCGHTREVDIEHPTRMRFAESCPREHCGGQLVASASSTLYYTVDPGDLDWDADRPRRGRPPKALRAA